MHFWLVVHSPMMVAEDAALHPSISTDLLKRAGMLLPTFSFNLNLLNSQAP